MKKVILTILVFFTSLSADVNTQKAVFDCASGDMKFVNSRMWLIEQSAKEFTKKDTPYDFVLTIHSKCTKIVNKNTKDKAVKNIQKRLAKLSKQFSVKVEPCGIAVKRFKYKKSDLPEYMDVVDNSITRVIELQNSGYAFIPYH